MIVVNDAFVENLQGILLKRIAEEKLILPVLPTVALEVRRELDRDDVKLPGVAKIIERDPVMTAQLLKTANSALYSRGQKIESVRRALQQLGVKNIKSIILTAAAREVFRSRNKAINEVLSQLWRHACAVALLAQDIAGLVECEGKDSAYLAGLMHDIGQPVVAIYLLEVERALMTRQRRGPRGSATIAADDWLRVVDSIHQPVGVAVTKQWGMPAVVCEAVSACSDYDTGNRTSVTNAVRFADALATRLGACAGPVDMKEVDATLMVGYSILGVEKEVVEQLAEDVLQRIDHPD